MTNCKCYMAALVMSVVMLSSSSQHRSAAECFCEGVSSDVVNCS